MVALNKFLECNIELITLNSSRITNELNSPAQI